MGDTSDISHTSMMCVCCFYTKGTLIKLDKCEHVTSFIKIFENKLNCAETYVCSFCHQNIIKINNFTRQVEKSISSINKLYDEFRYKPHDLQISATEINYAINNDVLQNEIINNITLNIDISKEIKTEEVLQSEDEDDYSLKDMYPEIQEIDTVNTKTATEQLRCREMESEGKKAVEIYQPKESRQNEKEYEGKIKVTTLTWKEILDERQMESTKAKYLSQPYKCEDCIVGFAFKDSLELHMKNRHESKKGGFRCSLCKTTLRSKRGTRQHHSRHVKRYECMVCGIKKNDFRAMVNHYNEKHTEIKTKYTCKDCNLTFESQRKYIYHRGSHKETSPCNECGRTFTNPTALKIHVV